MKKGKEIMLTDSMEGFQEKKINYNNFEVSFRRWLVIQIDSGNMTCREARERFSLPTWEYKKIIRRWQERYSDEIHLSLQAMNAKERTDVKALEKRIRELEKQLERAQMKNVALSTMINFVNGGISVFLRNAYL
jgi:polyhydroxyalkanoate synthesis regulator phasin